MLTQRRYLLITLLLPLAIAACADGAQVTEPAIEPGSVSAIERSANAATVQHGTFTSPFPPNPAIPFAPVSAPCLGLGEPLQMSGTWTGWFRMAETARGHVHVTEHIDYSAVGIRLGELAWVAGPGASETIVLNLPATPDDIGESAYNFKHRFTARFVSQDGLPDLRVRHSIDQLLGPDGELRRNIIVPFTAECIGRAR